jgi:hypothetical protein
MSGIDNWSQAERDLYAIGSRALLDDLERQQREWREGVALDTTATDAMLADAAARSRAAQEETRRYLASLAGNDESPHTDVASQGQGRQDVSGAEPATAPSAPGPGQQPTPHAADLAEAQRIRQLPMSAWAEERQRLIRASASNHGMF